MFKLKQVREEPVEITNPNNERHNVSLTSLSDYV